MKKKYTSTELAELNDELFFLYIEADEDMREEIANEIVLLNLGLVQSEATKYISQCKHCSLEDLMSEGTLGLMEAIKQYCPGKASFSSYAIWSVKGRIYKALYADSLIHVPYNMVTTLLKFRHSGMSFAEYFKDVSPELYHRYEVGYRAFFKVLSLESTVLFKNNTTSEDKELIDILADEDTNVEQESIKCMDKEVISRILSVVTEREKQMIQLYYLEGMTFERIGEEYHVTRERVRQIINNALRKMRRYTTMIEKINITYLYS